MLRSMTAFGRASLHTQVGRFVVEIQSVNKRFLDVQVQLPRELMRFDLELKKWISSKVARGFITGKIFVEFENQVPFSIKPNIPLVRQLKAAWEQIAAEIGNPPLTLELLATQEGILLHTEEFPEEADFREALEIVVNQALDQLTLVKDREGAVLALDLEQRLAFLKKAVKIISSQSHSTVQNYRKKLEERLKEYFAGALDNEDRILREICIYADRMDISEELTRFNAHLDHFQELLSGKETSIGKTIDFVIQELGREVNTMGSKSADSEISRLVVEMKGELERIREQVQNVE